MGRLDRFDLDGRFFEGPRWREGRWWVSDMTGRTVYSLTHAEARIEATLEDRPSGLGWLPDGSLLVVGMDGRRLHRRAPDGALQLYADLRPLCPDVHGHLNDMVTTADGNLYVGFDPDFEGYGFQSEMGSILHVDPRGRAAVAAQGLFFPNGMVVAEAGSALIVAETGGAALQRFAIAPDGALADRRLWAPLSSEGDRRVDAQPTLSATPPAPDGCALDVEGRVWVSDSNTGACLRVGEGGEILDAVFLPAPYRCLACALGGEDGRTLALCGLDLRSGGLETSVSHLFHTEVDTPGVPV